MNHHLLSTFSNGLNVAVIGASGGIGRATVELLAEQAQVNTILAYSRSEISITNSKVTAKHIDFMSEISIQNAVASIGKGIFLDIVIVATGMLHDNQISPEKSLKDLSMSQLTQVFTVNTFGPAIIARYFLPRMRREKKSVFACLSARVGSISDNRLGGWYAYRSSKSALNMMIKSAAIEMSRRNKQTCVVGLHPGTVDTELSKPFQSSVKKDKLFSPNYSSECLLKVVNGLSTSDSGKVFSWDGIEVPA